MNQKKCSTFFQPQKCDLHCRPGMTCKDCEINTGCSDCIHLSECKAGAGPQGDNFKIINV